jgi:hypothetical protein
MLSVCYVKSLKNTFMLSVIMLNVVMLNVVVPCLVLSTIVD